MSRGGIAVFCRGKIRVRFSKRGPLSDAAEFTCKDMIIIVLWIHRFPSVVYLYVQNLTLETVSQKSLPCALAISSSSSVGWREPSAPAKVPAPHGDPEILEGQGRARGADSTMVIRRTTVDLGEVGQEREDGLVAERDEDDTVVGQRRESGVDSHLLPSSGGTGRNEDTSVLASEGTLDPEPTSSIPKGLRQVCESVSVILSNRRGGESGITFH